MRLLLASAFILAHLSASFATSAPPPVCYVKSQKCCYAYSVCDYVTRKEAVVVPCPFEKCANVCINVCKLDPTKVLKKQCADKKVKAGQVCTNDKVYINEQYVWKKTCKDKYTYKLVCVDNYVIENKQVCRRVCKKKCRTVKANCTKYNVVKYAKYCAALSCDLYVTSGITAKPFDIVGKQGKQVETIEGKRDIIG